MSGAQEGDVVPSAEANGSFDPQAAAALLGETQRQARREFDVHPPALALIRAVAVLVGYGAIWWSVRGQQPYARPDGTVLLIVVAVVVLTLAAGAQVTRRATAGISGPSLSQRRAVLVVFVIAYVAVLLVMVALYRDGAAAAIVYGVFPATAPLIVGGTALAGVFAAQEDWLALVTALAVVLVAALSAFAGPVTVWLVTGVGCCLVLVGYAAAQLWRQKA
jgi:hypothetical protein